MINVAVYNRASTPLPFRLEDQVNAMQAFLNLHFTPIWGIAAKLSVTTGPVKGYWGLVFMDTADQPGALAYHDEENNEPLSKVFVKTTLDAHEDVSVSASHELVEMLCDAACNRYVTEQDGSVLMAFEVADPVEDQSETVNDFAMTNFVTPRWFEPQPFGQGVTQFDWLGKLDRPFQLSGGGYAVTGGAGAWTQIFGSDEKAQAFEKQDRRGRRGWLRVQKGAWENHKATMAEVRKLAAAGEPLIEIPPAPPVDNAHVAEGCEKFSESTGE